MADITVPRFVNAITRAFGVKGRGSSPRSITDEVTPVWLLTDPADPVHYFPRGEHPCTAAAGVDAAAAQFPTIHLGNAAAGTLTVVDYVLLSANANTRVLGELGVFSVTDLGTNNKDITDTRSRAGAAATPQTRIGATSEAAPILGEVLDVRIGANAPLLIPLRIVLAETFAFKVQGQTADGELVATFRFYERPADPEELR